MVSNSIYIPYDIYDIEKIEIVRSDICDYDVVKIYEFYNEHELQVKKNTGVKWVYDNILTQDKEKKPDVYVVDTFTRILRHKLEV